MLTTRPRGTNDILPAEAIRWQYVTQVARETCRLYGYTEISTPVFEHTELFTRGVGESTDIVEKEMYTFADRGKRSITLRPEGTAPTVRAFLEHKLYAQSLPWKVFYLGPMFRYNRPQSGRLRQFHQFGVEVIGTKDPALDAEVITLAMDFYARLGLTRLDLVINSVGCPQCRPGYRDKLMEHFKPVEAELCPTCQGRFQRNPMRILDCKNLDCRGFSEKAPTIGQYLCPDCQQHFQAVLAGLDQVGTPFKADERLVRGLDYYTNTAFEIMVQGIGAQSSIGGGGRYDGLVEECGGPPTPGIGFALGLERILLTMDDQKVKFPDKDGLQVFVALVDEEGAGCSQRVLYALRRSGISADRDFLGRSLKAQLKYADKFRAKFTVFLGGAELGRKSASVRNMATGFQEEVPLAELVAYLKQKM